MSKTYKFQVILGGTITVAEDEGKVIGTAAWRAQAILDGVARETLAQQAEGLDINSVSSSFIEHILSPMEELSRMARGSDLQPSSDTPEPSPSRR